ncbi:hypothetical protein TWF594_001738 [Orbilia oligospora]|uniref:Uncharacterized protein n=1 Tax=Orbilia oligospora TaxID=2813651 RepID=A0A7C8JQ55_ORBOL|nr:hypothetical protein TWF703_000619 [Orbilia oligospora]KAF3124889.1 hypothetical protein TWF594_001738 [Orbilia oligospora]
MGQSQQEMLHSGRLVLQLEGGGECPHPELAPALDVSSVEVEVEVGFGGEKLKLGQAAIESNIDDGKSSGRGP